MNRDVFALYKKLKEKPSVDKGFYLVESIPFSKKHKIGITEGGLPVFFIESRSDKFIPNIHLDLIIVEFNQLCMLEECTKIFEGMYDIIFLKTENDELQKYFCDVFCLILRNFSSNISGEQIKEEIQKFVRLFRLLSEPPKKSIQGLWAEMLVILASSDPEYMVQSWHVSPADKYDFNDGINKLEVKSTKKTRRIHSFALEQLNPNENSKLAIASIFVVETGVGKSILDLRNMIAKKLLKKDLVVKIDQIIVQTLGSSINTITDLFFDYKQAIDSLRLYESNKIPSISPKEIPPNISDVHFSVDLTNVPYLQKNASTKQRKLFGGLLK